MAKRKKHKTTTLRRDLAAVLNTHSRESNSNTPDFILARYLIGCLEAFEQATAARAEWWSGSTKRMMPVAHPPYARPNKVINISTPGPDHETGSTERERWLKAVENVTNDEPAQWEEQ